MNIKHIALGLLATVLCCTVLNAAPAVTLTNLNAAYFLVNANPASIPTNVVRLSGNLTNWQKFATNVILAINPTPGYLPYNNAGVFADSWLLMNGNDINLTAAGNPSYLNVTDGAALLSVGIAGVNGLVQGGTLLNVLDIGGKGITIDDTAVYPAILNENLGTSAAPWNSFYLTNQIVWGPGTTNVMYRSGTDLVYTNGAYGISAVPAFKLYEGDGKWVCLTFDQIGGGMVDGSTANFTVNQSYLITHNVIPYGNTYHVGTINNSSQKFEYMVALTNFTSGFDDGAGNYSRLAISHTGTNGYVTFDSQAAGTAGAARPFVFQAGTTTNAFRINATNWVDSMVPALGIIPGATAPTLGTFGTGGALKTYMFADNRDDEANFTVQLNHTYKQGTDIQPHVHWAGVAAPTTPANTNIVWELTYSWQNVGDAYSTDTTITVTNSFTGTAWKHQLSDLPAISGSGKTVSSIIIGRIRRVANSATADNYDKSCAFLGFDVHHQVDSPGSDSVGSKSF